MRRGRPALEMILRSRPSSGAFPGLPLGNTPGFLPAEIGIRSTRYPAIVAHILVQSVSTMLCMPVSLCSLLLKAAVAFKA